MPQIELCLRAYPVVRVDGQAVPLALKRGLALLALLAELGRKVARTQLSELLWPDAASDVGRGRLRRLVHETNQALGIDAIVGDGDALWLAGEAAAVVSDVERTRRLARQVVTMPADQHSREALEDLLQPDAHQVLEGFEFGADTFDTWLAQRRSEQHRLVARALQRAGEQLVASGQPLLAAEAAARLIAIEPLADAGHALLLRAHAQRGDLAAMESAYLAFAELLRGELGVRPSPTYEALYEQARRHVMQAAPSSQIEFASLSGLPPIRFADTSDGAVAYLEHGGGDITLLILFGVWSNLEVAWEAPQVRAVLDRLAQRFRVVLVDRRGTGLSERVGLPPTLAAGAEDIEAVRRALGVERVWLFGNSVGGMTAIEYAVRYPAQVHGLLLYSVGARGSWASDYPWALTVEQLDKWLAQLHDAWGSAVSLAQYAPSVKDDPAMQQQWARMMRHSATKNSMRGLLKSFSRMDVRDLLPRIAAPTLVVQREHDLIVRAEAGRHLAAQIPGAKLVMLPGMDHIMWVGDTDAVIDEVERFVEGVQR